MSSEPPARRTSAPPPVLEVLWGPDRTSRRTRSRPGLTRERIVDAAIELADAGGLAAVSMSRVAERLGFTTMSLYRHVASKEDLLLLMVDGAASEPPDLTGLSGWRSRLEHWSWRHFDALRQHPWMVSLVTSGMQLTPGQMSWLDRGLAAFDRTSLPEADKAGVMLLLTGYILSSAQLAVVPEPEAGTDVGEAMTYGSLLARVADAERFPALHRTVAAGVFDGPDGFSDADFDFGLQRVLDGVHTLIRSRGRASGDRGFS